MSFLLYFGSSWKEATFRVIAHPLREKLAWEKTYLLSFRQRKDFALVLDAWEENRNSSFFLSFPQILKENQDFQWNPKKKKLFWGKEEFHIASKDIKPLVAHFPLISKELNNKELSQRQCILEFASFSSFQKAALALVPFYTQTSPSFHTLSRDSKLFYYLLFFPNVFLLEKWRHQKEKDFQIYISSSSIPSLFLPLGYYHPWELFLNSPISQKQSHFFLWKEELFPLERKNFQSLEQGFYFTLPSSYQKEKGKPLSPPSFPFPLTLKKKQTKKEKACLWMLEEEDLQDLADWLEKEDMNSSSLRFGFFETSSSKGKARKSLLLYGSPSHPDFLMWLSEKKGFYQKEGCPFLYLPMEWDLSLGNLFYEKLCEDLELPKRHLHLLEIDGEGKGNTRVLSFPEEAWYPIQDLFYFWLEGNKSLFHARWPEIDFVGDLGKKGEDFLSPASLFQNSLESKEYLPKQEKLLFSSTAHVQFWKERIHSFFWQKVEKELLEKGNREEAYLAWIESLWFASPKNSLKELLIQGIQKGYDVPKVFLEREASWTPKALPQLYEDSQDAKWPLKLSWLAHERITSVVKDSSELTKNKEAFLNRVQNLSSQETLAYAKDFLLSEFFSEDKKEKDRFVSRFAKEWDELEPPGHGKTVIFFLLAHYYSRSNNWKKGDFYLEKGLTMLHEVEREEGVLYQILAGCILMDQKRVEGEQLIRQALNQWETQVSSAKKGEVLQGILKVLFSFSSQNIIAHWLEEILPLFKQVDEESLWQLIKDNGLVLKQYMEPSLFLAFLQYGMGNRSLFELPSLFFQELCIESEENKESPYGELFSRLAPPLPIAAPLHENLLENYFLWGRRFFQNTSLTSVEEIRIPLFYSGHPEPLAEAMDLLVRLVKNWEDQQLSQSISKIQSLLALLTKIEENPFLAWILSKIAIHLPFLESSEMTCLVLDQILLLGQKLQGFSRYLQIYLKCLEASLRLNEKEWFIKNWKEGIHQISARSSTPLHLWIYHTSQALVHWNMGDITEEIIKDILMILNLEIPKQEQKGWQEISFYYALGAFIKASISKGHLGEGMEIGKILLSHIHKAFMQDPKISEVFLEIVPLALPLDKVQRIGSFHYLLRSFYPLLEKESILTKDIIHIIALLLKDFLEGKYGEAYFYSFASWWKEEFIGRILRNSIYP